MSHVRIEGTTWPVNFGEAQWRLVYGTPSRADCLLLSSVVSAYAHLTDPGITQAAAVAALKRGRRAVVLADGGNT